MILAVPVARLFPRVLMGTIILKSKGMHLG
ncbi:hypothetical protein SAMN05216534_1539 [Candidatus Aquiluna sp. UB-MaderosW2red]|jgi:hypothetical protein|nr:hypothetical protein SAMN05216534_1539 [Candidatus Aquiluna sp. UB-MaderosW2red]